MMMTFRTLMGFLALIGLLLSVQSCCKKDPRWCQAPKEPPKPDPNKSKLMGKGDAYTKIPGNDPYQCNFYGCDNRMYPIVFYHSNDEPFPFLKGFKPPGLSQVDVNSNFKDRGEYLHWGIDMRMAQGQPVYSTTEGVATLRNFGDEGCGKFVTIEDRGSYSYFCHLSSWAVSDGQPMHAAELVGFSGNTGNSSGAHLHYANCPLYSGDKFTLYSYCYCPIGCGNWNVLGPNP